MFRSSHQNASERPYLKPSRGSIDLMIISITGRPVAQLCIQWLISLAELRNRGACLQSPKNSRDSMGNGATSGKRWRRGRNKFKQERRLEPREQESLS